ncbi:MAG TPA: alpha/beta fold hydrolase [Ktedonobacteraceae bacterium]|nr:alpha/beta fold hydrolase [Ktedonobacteraceae bacterium]
MLSQENVAPQVEVLIVGAGPVGLTAALELARRGISCRLIDQAEGPSPYSRALGIHPRTLEHLEQMGVVDEVLERGVLNYANNVYADGRRLIHLHTAASEGEALADGVLFLSQVDVEAILRKRLSAYDVTIEYRTMLQELQQDEQGVTAVLRPAEGDPISVRANWLIGCDGAHSTVRKQLGLSFLGSQEETWLVADAQIDWELNVDALETHIFFAEEGGIIAFPYPERGRWRLLDMSPTSSSMDQDERALIERISRRMVAASAIQPIIQRLLWTSRFTVQQRKVPHLRVGRCFVAGDAAHSHSPAGGQGMNTGIQDAYNLAWKLALVSQQRARPEILNSYTEEREPFARQVLRGTLILSQMLGLKDPMAIGLRNQLLKMAVDMGFQTLPAPMAKQISQALFQLNVDYENSSLVAESWPKAPLFANAPQGWSAGKRVPNVSFGGSPLKRGPRLFELLREADGKQVLLIFTGWEEDHTVLDHLSDVGRTVEERYGESIVVHMVVPHPAVRQRLSWTGSVLLDGRNPEASLQGLAGIQSNGLILLRPDVVVGYRCQPVQPDHFFAYLQRHFIAAGDQTPAAERQEVIVSETAPSPASPSFLTVDGASIAYEVRGTGPETIVFAHSFPTGRHLFDAQLEAFQGHYRCIVLDWPGLGESRILDDSLTVDRLLQDLVILMQLTDAVPCHYVGVSMGGYFGLLLARRHSELLRSLTVISAGPQPEPVESLQVVKMLRHFGAQTLADMMLSLAFGHTFLTDPAREQQRMHWRQYLAGLDSQQAARLFLLLSKRPDLSGELAQLTVPIQILIGDQDASLKVEQMRRLYEPLPGAPFHVIAGAGHSSPVEEPQVVNTLLSQFWQAHSLQSAYR